MNLQEIVQKGNWYLELNVTFTKYFLNYKQNYDSQIDDHAKSKFRTERNNIILELADLFKKDKIALGSPKEFFFDEQRKPIDTIVIHHTSRPTNTPLEVMEVIHLLNLYIREFSNPNKPYYGKPLFSGHLRDDKQTFLAYHYIIKNDGKIINTLDEKYIGWHCGNWDYNCRSIAVTFDDDLDESRPSQAALESARELIRKYSPKNILGHREIVNTTTCPGNLFLGEEGWKQELFIQN